MEVVISGSTRVVTVPSGSTVDQALSQAGVVVGNLDRIIPAGYTVLSPNAVIQVIRVGEKFEIVEVTIPFEKQTVKNETLSVGKMLLIQPGVNGIQEFTYRKVIEDGVEKSNTVFKTTTLKEPVPEISMIGVQSPFTSIPLPGILAYLTAGNAWVMEGTTANRRPLLTTGDLDTRVFAVSPDKKWLLFSRKPTISQPEHINELWVVSTKGDGSEPINLNAYNVYNFAGWDPNQPQTVIYSSVEPRSTAPGWQANNDLQMVTFTSNGKLETEEIITANSGGIYGWWGTIFAWSLDGTRLSFARPDAIGIVNLEKKEFQPIYEIIPLQTGSDWAWVPGLSWSPDSTVLYSVAHNPGSGLVAPEESPLFDMIAIPFTGGTAVPIATQSGMFTYPLTSPLIEDGNYLVAYLQAIFPEQSQTSRYRLVVMDRDGSNRRELFPPEGSTGIDPRPNGVAWSPKPIAEGEFLIALLYQGNLWLVNSTSGQTYQVTGDSLLNNIDWK